MRRPPICQVLKLRAAGKAEKLCLVVGCLCDRFREVEADRAERRRLKQARAHRGTDDVVIGDTDGRWSTGLVRGCRTSSPPAEAAALYGVPNCVKFVSPL